MAIYETLGRYYDALVKDEEASQSWVDWIESFNPGSDFFELACGSGEITERLAANHTVTALDLSQNMIDAAKAKEGAKDIVFVQGDMRDLHAFGQYDAIGCFCDSFNYLDGMDEVKAFFAEVRSHLKEDGLFLFDSHSLCRLDEFEDDYTEAGTFDDGTQVQWIISAEEGKIYQDFAFYFDERTVEEHHVQTVFDPEQLIEALGEAGFELLSISGDFGEAPLEDCEKYFIAARAV